MADVTDLPRIDLPGPGSALEQEAGDVFDQLDYGLMVTAPGGAVQEANGTAWRLLEVEPGEREAGAHTCCALFGCGRDEPLTGDCITELALGSDEPLPEMRIDLSERGLWVTAAKGAGGDRVLMHLRPGGLGDRRRRTHPHWMTPPQLRVRALGNTHVESPETTLGGDWLLQRPGRLLKFLLIQPGRRAHVDEIIEVLWPDAGTSGRSTVRYYVHILRHRLEPRREEGQPSSFISALNGTYSIDPRVSVDVDEFEALMAEGLRDPAGRSAAERQSSLRCLKSALDLYQGDLFAEDPYAEWALAERERLRGLARSAIGSVVAAHRREGDIGAALRVLERHAEGWPLDAQLQRLLIGLSREAGRRTDAARRYDGYRARLASELGEEPGFSLADA